MLGLKSGEEIRMTIVNNKLIESEEWY